MKRSRYLAAALEVCLIIIVFLLIKAADFSGELQAAIEKNNLIAADLQASIRRTEPELVTLKESASGLGEIYDNDPIACGQTLVCCETLNGAGRI
jgi:hypothetical protein